MSKSARLLGQTLGLSAQEINFILKEEGFLAGEPGKYSVTEKGAKYAIEKDFQRGTGGYDHYNRHWNTRSWDDGIISELDITDDKKKAIREAITVAKRKINEANGVEKAIDLDNVRIDEINSTDTNKKVLIIAIIVLLLAVSSYGLYKAAPYIKRWWNNKVEPRLKRLKEEVIGDSKMNSVPNNTNDSAYE